MVDRIEIDPRRCGGAPVIKGTRIPVTFILDQLANGGKLLAPVGRTPFTQELVLVEKSASGKVTGRSVLSVMFVPMVRGEE